MTLQASKIEEEAIFLMLFSYSLIGKPKEWYLDQPTTTMIDWDASEEKRNSYTYFSS